MFSGKTTYLGQKVHRSRLAGVTCVIVKHVRDTRYRTADDDVRGPTIYTHSKHTISTDSATADLAALTVVEAAKLGDIPDGLITPTALIAVDEGQFFPDLVETVDGWMRLGFQVVVAALSGDFLRRPFPQVSALIPLATKCTTLSAVCMLCDGPRNDATYTLRTVTNTDVELIGAKGMYKSACLTCYLTHSTHTDD